MNKMMKKVMLEYLEYNLPIIPCKEKFPLLKGWNQRNGTTEEDVLEWINTWPMLNIGLILGKSSGIVGIDIDGVVAKERLKELCKGDLPETWTFVTPGGGLRYLYRIPEGFPAKKYIEDLEGDHSELALLGTGQQTILPPSIHPNGKRYKWIKGKRPGAIELAAAPKWLLDLMGDTPQLSKKQAKNKAIKGATKTSKKETSQVESQDIFERLKRKCSQFQEDLIVQTAQGLHEEQWFRWIALLVNAGHPEAAEEFSVVSSKHDQRSEERLEQLIEESGGERGAMTRCTTLGCSEGQVEKCFVEGKRNLEGQLTNSPGSWIVDMSQMLPPQGAVYKPYLKALKTTGIYDIDERGNLCSFDKKENPVVIANFVARPVMEIIKDDGLNEDRYFRIEGVSAGGQQLAPVDVSSSDFAGMNWVLKNWGLKPSIRAGVGTKDKMRDAIQNATLGIEEHRIYTHLGWRKLEDGIWVYLHSDGAVGSAKVSVDLDPQLQRYSLPSTVSNLKKAAAASLEFLKLAPYEVTLPLLSLVYLAPLVEPFRQVGLEPNFSGWLYGATGTRKTSLSLVLLQHLGEFAGKQPPASFKDTANAIERKAFYTKDSLLLVDDFHPSASNAEGQKMAHVAQRVLRMYGDRIGRGRLKSSTSFQQEYFPRGLVLITGEDVPKGHSSMARFLGIEVLKGQIDLDLLTKFQKKGKILSSAMAGYLQWLAPQMNELPQELAREFYDLRSEFQKKSGHGRTGEAAAWLQVAYQKMIQHLIFRGVLKEKKQKEYLALGHKVFWKIIKDQTSLVSQEAPEVIFVEALMELLDLNKVHTKDLLSKTTASHLYPAGYQIGWHDNDYYYLYPKETISRVNHYLKQRQEVLPLSASTLWKNLDEAGLIETKEENGEYRRTLKKTIPGKGGPGTGRYLRLLHLKKAEVEKLVMM